MEFSKAEAKEWAKKNMKGLEAVIFPSFTPDLQDLDEEGIRYDVQHLADNGFTSALCASEVCGMTFDERIRFVEIVCDEAKGKIHTSITALHDTVEPYDARAVAFLEPAVRRRLAGREPAAKSRPHEGTARREIHRR